MQEILIKIRYFGQDYEKQNGLGTGEQLLFRLENTLKNSFISDVIPNQVWWCNKQFLSYSKITSANLCKPIHDIINYSTFNGIRGKITEKIEYLKNIHSFIDTIKSIFHNFRRPIIWWKNSWHNLQAMLHIIWKSATTSSASLKKIWLSNFANL